MNIALLERHGSTIPIEMIIGLSAESLERYLWQISLEWVKDRRKRELGVWLFELTAAELKRRQADGEVEAGSFDFPSLTNDELGAAMIGTNVFSYADLPDDLCELFDHLHLAFVIEASRRLKEQ